MSKYVQILKCTGSLGIGCILAFAPLDPKGGGHPQRIFGLYSVPPGGCAHDPDRLRRNHPVSDHLNRTGRPG